MKISSIIVTAIFAGAAGAIAGTLFAPGKGSKTRRNISRKGQEYKDYMQDSFDDFADSVSHPFENLEDETMRLNKKAKSKANEVIEAVNEKLN